MLKSEYQRLRANNDFKHKLRPLGLQLMIDSSLLGTFLVLLRTDFSLVTVPLLPILMFRSFSLMHDAVHGAAHPNKRWNAWVGTWAGALTLLPFEAWKHSHLEHHFWSGNIERDPVMALRLKGPQGPKTFLLFLNLCWRLWIPVLGIAQNILFWVLALTRRPAGQKLSYTISLVLPLAVWGLIAVYAYTGGHGLILLYGLLAYYLLVEVVNLPHHLQTPVVRGNSRLFVWEQEQSARSCIYPRWFARHIVMNFNYHAEHHIFPDAPWYKLDDLHKQLKESTSAKLNLDQNMEWILRSRQLSIESVVQSDSTDAINPRSAS